MAEQNTITIYPERKSGRVSPNLCGICMEDVNHELYGGIWSQMLFGESFAEKPRTVIGKGFTDIGGNWYVKKFGNDKNICIESAGEGPKTIVEGTVSTRGSFSVDMMFDGEAAGFTIKTSNAQKGGNSFDGYEISLLENLLRVASHHYNHENIADIPCRAAKCQWVNIRADYTADTIKVYVGGEKIFEYKDENPIERGAVALRACAADARYKNLRFAGDNGIHRELIIPDEVAVEEICGAWDAFSSGNAQGEYQLITESQYKGSRSQKILKSSADGSFGIANRGLNRKGIPFKSGRDYEGFIIARADCPITVTAAIGSQSSGRKYASAELKIENNEWKKYSFRFDCTADDINGQFIIETAEQGSFDIGYAFLQPGEWDRYKSLPVRRDVAELIEKQGISVIRLGGSMVNAAEYRWKDMLGETEIRPPYNGMWYNCSSFGFGIVEFLDMCEAMNVIGIPDISSYEKPGDVADMIKYLTGTNESDPCVKRRIDSGHREPYRLPFLQIGNEEKVDRAYTERFLPIAENVWAVNRDITLIVGDFDYKEVITDPYNITGSASGITTLENHKRILTAAAANGRRVWFDIHMWTEHIDRMEPDNFINAGISLYNMLKEMCPRAEFALPVFEFNAASHDFERALCNAYGINRIERLGEIFPIVCSANALQVDKNNDNSWDQGLIFMDNEKSWYQPPAYIHQMFADAYLPCTAEFETDMSKDDPALDFTATANEDATRSALKIVNRTGDKKRIIIRVDGFVGGAAKTCSFAAPLDAVNTGEAPNAWIPTKKTDSDGFADDGRLEIEIDGYSVTVMKFTK